MGYERLAWPGLVSIVGWVTYPRDVLPSTFLLVASVPFIWVSFLSIYDHFSAYGGLKDHAHTCINNRTEPNRQHRPVPGSRTFSALGHRIKTAPTIIYHGHLPTRAAGPMCRYPPPASLVHVPTYPSSPERRLWAPGKTITRSLAKPHKRDDVVR
jgi:hypothetical protein